MSPLLAPPMLGERVDTAPNRNNDRVKELLTPTRPSEPKLTHQQEDRKKDPVGDKRTSHDKMCQTLSHVIIMAESQGRNPPKYHLYPTCDRHYFPDDSVDADRPGTQFAVYPPRQVEFEVYA